MGTPERTPPYTSISMAPPPDYEPSLAPAEFTTGWREKLRSQPQQASPTYSLTDDDCPFEYADQPLDNEAVNATGNEVDRQRHDWAGGSPSLALPDLDNLEHNSPEVSMALASTFLRQ